jgi:hypothetical protein
MYRFLTVVTPAQSQDMTTRDRIKDEIGIIGNDTLIDGFIRDASRAAAKYCHREFIAQEVTETFRPYPYVDSASLTNLPEFIYLRRFPVTTFSLANDGMTLLFTADGEALVEGTDFECDRTTGRLVWLSNDMPLRWHFSKIVCQYTGGYTFPGTLEADIERAVIEIVKDMWFARKRDPMLRQMNIPGVADLQYWVGGVGGDSWPPKVSDLLAPYIAAMF